MPKKATVGPKRMVSLRGIKTKAWAPVFSSDPSPKRMVSLRGIKTFLVCRAADEPTKSEEDGFPKRD